MQGFGSTIPTQNNFGLQGGLQNRLVTIMEPYPDPIPEPGLALAPNPSIATPSETLASRNAGSAKCW